MTTSKSPIFMHIKRTSLMMYTPQFVYDNSNNVMNFLEHQRESLDSLSSLTFPGKKICLETLKHEAFNSRFGPDGARFYTGKGYKGQLDVMKSFSENALQSCRLSEPVGMTADLKIFDHPKSIKFDFATGTFSNFNCQAEISNSNAIDAKFSSELCKRLVTSKGSANNSKPGEDFTIECQERGKSVSIRFRFNSTMQKYLQPEILNLYETPEAVSGVRTPEPVPNRCECHEKSVPFKCFGPGDSYAAADNNNTPVKSCRIKEKGDTCKPANSGGSHPRRRLLASRSMVSASRALRGAC